MVNNFLLCVSFHFVLCRGLQRIVWKITQSQAFGFKETKGARKGIWQDGLAMGRE